MGKSIAKIKIKTDKIEDFIKAVEKACPLIRQEEGCIFYELYQTEADPTEFYYCEEWRNEEDLKKHLSQPHVAELIQICEDLTDGDVTPIFWHKVV